MNSKLTLNMGLRWDVFVPWVEEDDRQSNYDPSTGFFVVASDDAVINGVQASGATCRPTPRATSGRASASPTT